MVDQREFRLEALLKRTSSLSIAAELLDYGQPLPPLPTAVRLPLAPEPHLDAWQRYAAEAQTASVFEVLRQKLVQLQFPVAAGISQTLAYQAATRRGAPPGPVAHASGLALECPEALQLRVCSTLAGAIPVLIAGCRPDFVALVQALVKKNEPEPVPDSMGSCLVSGYVNWDRISELHRRWEATGLGLSWAEEFQQMIAPHKELYQDRFLILSSDAYSDVPAGALGLSDGAWREMSVTIRLEHEAVHYLVFRLFSQIRTNVLDELWADYWGIVAVWGHYRADWGLRFLGLHDYPTYYPGSRLENYRRTLSDEAFCVVQTLVRDAALNLEQIDRQVADQRTQVDAQSRLLLALFGLSLEELASDHAQTVIQQALIRV